MMADAKKAVIWAECPEFLLQAIRGAARDNMISSSAYARQAALERLKRDGYDPKSGDVA
jgi:hypothetical protein